MRPFCNVMRISFCKEIQGVIFIRLIYFYPTAITSVASVEFGSNGSSMGLVRFKPVKQKMGPRAEKLGGSLADLIPQGVSNAKINVDGRAVQLTHLDKPFWPGSPGGRG